MDEKMEELITFRDIRCFDLLMQKQVFEKGWTVKNFRFFWEPTTISKIWS